MTDSLLDGEDHRDAGQTLLASKAVQSALAQQRRGSRESVRDLYYDAHSLLRTLRHHLPISPEAA